MIAALASLAWGGTLEEAQQAELDRVRAEVADQVQLAAYDLVDELVYGWVSEPVFETPTPVVLAAVTVPVGLGTGMQALLENHVASVLSHNPTSNVRLVHCPACTAVVVHAGPQGTVVSRGIDDPSVLADVGGDGQHALFVDVEAEGSWLVLRARITRLTPDLPIVWSHTVATSAGTPALLRQPEALKSAAEARQEYEDTLRDRGPATVPLRFAIRTYKSPNGDGGIGAPPFVWLQSGVELAPTRDRAWTTSLVLGYSFIPQAYQGMLGQARVSRLVTGRVRSLTRPDLYAFVGGAVVTVWGPATGAFQKEALTADQVIATLEGDAPRTSFGTFQVGLDLRVGSRIGMSTFLETMPDLASSNNLGDYVRIGTIGFQSLGTEVTFWF
ncbi:MAG: hypothetical protein ABMA64_07145 [Myxococcota bacterium]